jgi:hypothetical protein
LNRTRTPKIGIIALAAVLLTGLGLVPALNMKIDAQNEPQNDKLTQLKYLIMKSTCNNLIGPTAQAVEKGSPGVSSNSVQHLVQQLVKEVINNSGEKKACEDLRQIAYQVLANHKGIVASSLAVYVKQVANKDTHLPTMFVRILSPFVSQ